MVQHDHIVNNIIRGLSNYTETLNPNEPEWDKRQGELDALRGIMAEVKHLRSITRPVSKELGDLSDLPDELVAELTVSKTNDLEDQIYTIINAAGGSSNIDTILVELFRRFQVKQKRRFIQNKLWRMTQKEGVLWSDPDQKGVYLTSEPKTTEQDKPQIVEGVDNPFDLDDEIPF